MSGMTNPFLSVFHDSKTRIETGIWAAICPMVRSCNGTVVLFTMISCLRMIVGDHTRAVSRKSCPLDGATSRQMRVCTRFLVMARRPG
jgi:hypothetical protein